MENVRAWYGGTHSKIWQLNLIPQLTINYNACKLQTDHSQIPNKRVSYKIQYMMWYVNLVKMYNFYVKYFQYGGSLMQ
jgi:hypothetical protein